MSEDIFGWQNLAMGVEVGEWGEEYMKSVQAREVAKHATVHRTELPN